MADDSATDEPRAATVEVVREALQTGDVAPLGSVLAADVRWYGTGPGGGCRSREEVLETLREQLAGGLRPQLRDVRLAGDRAVLRVALARAEQDAEDIWFVLTLDAQGLIAELQDYSGAAAVAHDLAILAAGAPAAQPGRPASAVSGLVPYVHVADVERSVAFYRLLGFEALDSYEPGGDLVWAFLRSADASLMLALGEAPIAHREQAVFFYLYARDLTSLRDQLVAHRLAPGEIVDGSPGPRSEMRVTDPDGYVLMVAQIDADTIVGADASGRTT